MSQPLKKPGQSLTVRAALASALVPVLAYLATRYLGLDAETAGVIAGGLFAALAALAQYGLRRAQGLQG